VADGELEASRAFRAGLFVAFGRRRDALLDVLDALLPAEAVPARLWDTETRSRGTSGILMQHTAQSVVPEHRAYRLGRLPPRQRRP
jgi:hypothetical protein